MNHTSKKALRLTAMILVGAAFFMNGCGPDNLDDPTYLTETDEGTFANDAADKTETQPMAEEGRQEAPQATAEGMQQGNPEAQPTGGMPTGAPEGQPVVGAPAVAVVAPVVELPDAFVKLPSEFRANPPIVTESGEQINYQRRILHQRDIHVAQPAIENHLITKNLHTHNQFQTNIINHPTFSKNIAFAATASISSEVLPTTEITAPLVATPGIVGAGVGLGIGPVRPLCAPWLSGGFYRYCR